MNGSTPCNLVAWTFLFLGGCATTRPEPPPQVAPQPPAITTGQAIAEGEAAQRQVEQQQPDAAGPALASRAQRSRPTGRSTQEIREQNATSPYPLDFVQRLDHAHDRIYTWGQAMVEAADQRFADKDRPPRPVPAAPFRFGSTLTAIDRTDGTDVNMDLNLDVALQLPNLERRLRIFITSAELDGGPRNPGNESSLRAGLSYQLQRHLDFDLGIRVDVPPVAFAAIKWTNEYALGRWDFYPLAKIFAETKESFGYAAGLTFDRWSGRHLFRSSSFAKWRHDLDRTEWSHTLIYARANELLVPDRYGSYLEANDIGRGWGIRLLASGEDTREVSRYEAGLVFRSQAGPSWLYWHVEPLVRWDREYNWHADPGIRIGFDALFWNLARPAGVRR